MFEQFPYADMQQLNLDWIIQVIREFLNNYQNIQNLITTGEQDIQQLTTDGLASLENKATEIETLLNEWYDSHSADISQQLTSAIAEFNTTAQQTVQAIIDSLPPEYDSYVSEIRNNSMAYEPVNRLKYVDITTGAYRYYGDGSIRSNPDYCYSDYIVIVPDSLYTIENASNTHTTFYDVDRMYISGTTNSVFRTPANAVYMVVSYAIADSNITVTWSSNILTISPITIMSSSEFTDFNTAAWNRIYNFNITAESDWNNIGHYPIKRNGILMTIDSATSALNRHYAARQLYFTNDGFVFSRFYAPPINDFSEWIGSFSPVENTLTDLNNAKWNAWYIFNNASVDYVNTAHMPTLEDGTLFTYDNIQSNHFAGRQLYITISGKIYSRYWIPTQSRFTDWDYNNRQDGTLYSAELNSSNSSLFAGSFNASANGFEITNKAVFGRYYSIENRHCTWLGVPSADSNFDIYTAQGQALDANFVVNIDMANKSVRVLPFPTVSVPWLTGGHFLAITISKEYQKAVVSITDMNTGNVYDVEYTNNGAGGAGSGAISTPNNLPMQYDYYGVRRVSGTAVVMKKLSIYTNTCDVIMYGDSITEPEAYYPTAMYPESWTAMVIANSGKKVVTSGRSGNSINNIMERINNELPYVNAKYCVVTIGTNAAPTQAQLNNLITVIKANGCIPILNHIPCFNNNGDQTSFRNTNAVIDAARAAWNIKGADFDKATSVFYDGQDVNESMFFFEDYLDRFYYHHPNKLGSAAMYKQILIDIPEIM